MSDFLKYRSTEPELMDDLESDGPVIPQTLRELEIINRLLGGNQVTLKGIEDITLPEESLHIIDLGCGGGDMLMLICDRARKNDLNIHITGIDANPNIIEYARKNTSAYPEIDYKCCNIFSEEFQNLTCDIITATLFTHHFTNQQLIDLFGHFRHQAKRGMVINDLHRHWFAYHSISILTRFFSKSAMVRNDASLSVERSFLRTELEEILFKAGIGNYTLGWRWAFRWKLVARWDV